MKFNEATDFLTEKKNVGPHWTELSDLDDKKIKLKSLISKITKTKPSDIYTHGGSQNSQDAGYATYSFVVGNNEFGFGYSDKDKSNIVYYSMLSDDNSVFYRSKKFTVIKIKELSKQEIHKAVQKLKSVYENSEKERLKQDKKLYEFSPVSWDGWYPESGQSVYSWGVDALDAQNNIEGTSSTRMGSGFPISLKDAKKDVMKNIDRTKKELELAKRNLKVLNNK